jgi:hypothetical protein
MEEGPQPLDVLLQQNGLSNGDLVKASGGNLTFKMIGKGRKGRRLTSRIQRRILQGMRLLLPDSNLDLGDLFTYRGR